MCDRNAQIPITQFVEASNKLLINFYFTRTNYGKNF